MSYFKITLHRSAIGLPRRTRGVLAALGLRRRCQTVYHPVKADFAGMIMRVKELVRVEAVDEALTRADMKALRRPERGYWVERRAGAEMPLAGEGEKMATTAETATATADKGGQGLVGTVARPTARRMGEVGREDDKVDYAAIL